MATTRLAQKFGARSRSQWRTDCRCISVWAVPLLPNTASWLSSWILYELRGLPAWLRSVLRRCEVEPGRLISWSSITRIDHLKWAESSRAPLSREQTAYGNWHRTTFEVWANSLAQRICPRSVPAGWSIDLEDHIRYRTALRPDRGEILSIRLGYCHVVVPIDRSVSIARVALLWSIEFWWVSWVINNWLAADCTPLYNEVEFSWGCKCLSSNNESLGFSLYFNHHNLADLI